MKIVSLVERNGDKRSFHVTNVNIKTVTPILRAHIARNARLMSDQTSVYDAAGKEFLSHEKVNHSAGEYARGDVTTNTVESSFAILKRGLYGTFHSVSEKHLHRYVEEFDFRWNHRQVPVLAPKGSATKWVMRGPDDTERAAITLKGISGKRLTYRRTHARQAPTEI